MRNIGAQNISHSHFSNTHIHEVDFCISWVLLWTYVTIQWAVENMKIGEGGGKQSKKHNVYRYIQWHTKLSFAISYDPQASCNWIHTIIYSWFQTFAVFWMLYVFFWVIPWRLNLICRRFGTLCLFHLHTCLWRWKTDCSETSAYKIQTPGNYLKKAYYTYTGCPRRKGQNFGRVFLMLKYTDITQNTYIQSWTVMEITAREKCGLLAGLRTVPCQLTAFACLSSTAVSDYRNTADALTSVLHYGWLCMSCMVLETLKDNYDASAGFFVVQFNGFMSLTS